MPRRHQRLIIISFFFVVFVVDCGGDLVCDCEILSESMTSGSRAVGPVLWGTQCDPRTHDVWRPDDGGQAPY